MCRLARNMAAETFVKRIKSISTSVPFRIVYVERVIGGHYGDFML